MRMIKSSQRDFDWQERWIYGKRPKISDEAACRLFGHKPLNVVGEPKVCATCGREIVQGDGKWVTRLESVHA